MEGVVQAETREETLSRLVRAHQSALLRLCYLSLRDQELARDAVQETFLKAYEGYHNFRGDSTEKTWLASIALNVCRDMRRANWFRYVDRRVTPESLAMSATPADDAVDLGVAISHLPTKLREVVLLYYYEGMTIEEISATLHAAKSTISTRLKHALERLRITIEGGEEHD